MPQAKAKNAAGLSVELERELPFFRPGDDITGTVALCTAKDFAMGSVVVSLYGRVKVHFVQSHGEGESHWRGRAPLFEASLLLYSGHHTHKPGTFSWPFRLSVPPQPDQTLLMENKHQWQPKDSFLGSIEYSSDSAMPGTFTFRKRGFGYRWRAFIEYVLEVQIKEAEGTHLVMRPSQRRLVMPIRVMTLSDLQREHLVLPAGISFVMPTNPMSEKTSIGPTASSSKPVMSTQLSIHTVRASRLAPSEQELSNVSGRSSVLGALRERRNLLFSANSMPRFTFEVRVSVPETVRLLDSEKGISVQVAIKPVTGEEKTTIPDHAYPAIRLDHITVVLRSTTEIRFKGAFRERTSTAEYDIKLLDKAPIDHSIPMTASHNFCNTFNRGTLEDQRDGVDSSIPVAGTADSSTTGMVDLSTFPGLNICLGAAKQGSQTESPLAPSFRSYIITRRYELRWALLLNVVGERIKVESQGGTPLTVLSPTAEHATAYLEQTGQELSLTRSDTATSNGQGEDNSEAETEGVRRLNRRLTNLFNSKGSKAEEAATERAAAGHEASPDGEELPRYEQSRSSDEVDRGLRFENEIRGEPPVYQDVT